MKLQTHRHDNVGGIVVIRLLHQSAAVGVRQNQANLFGGHDAQHVEQVADVETDLQRLTVVLNADFFFCFFLFRVVGLNFQLAVGQLQTNATVLLVGQNRGAAERFTQRLTIASTSLSPPLGNTRS